MDHTLSSITEKDKCKPIFPQKAKNKANLKAGHMSCFQIFYNVANRRPAQPAPLFASDTGLYVVEGIGPVSVDTKLKVEVVAGGISCRSHITNNLSFGDRLSCHHRKGTAMGIQRRSSFSVIN